MGDKQVILTGLRTNAEYHLGNYLGAILPMVHMANKKAGEYQINMFAPDLHSFTTEIDHSKLFAQTMHNLKLFVACGLPIDNDSVYIYRQSYIAAHSELTVILNNFAYYGELSRMTQFKDKSQDLLMLENGSPSQTESGENLELESSGPKGKSITAGLFLYPVLMAADILLYGAEWVPVGEDQRQHLEFTRDVATRFNNKFGDVFVIPKTLKEQQAFVDRDSAPRIRSLRNPDKKMSKSIDDPSGTIKLSDTPEEARKKIMRAETDTVGTIHFDWEKQPGISNLIQILALLSGKPETEIAREWEGKDRYGDLKTAVADAVVNTLLKIQENMAIIADEDIVAKLESSEAAMAKRANETLLKAQKAVGLRA